MVANRESQTTSTPRSVSRRIDRKSTRLNSSHQIISYAVFCLKKKKHTSQLQSPHQLVCRLLLEKKKQKFLSRVFCNQRRANRARATIHFLALFMSHPNPGGSP